MAEISASMTQIAEGVPTAAATKALAAKLNLYLPILTTVHDVLIGEKSPKDAMYYLISLPLTPEGI